MVTGLNRISGLPVSTDEPTGSHHVRGLSCSWKNPGTTLDRPISILAAVT